MKVNKKVLKWNFSVFNTETQSITYSVDYNYNHDDYMLALREMLDHLEIANTHLYMRKLQKVTRIERVDAPGIQGIKKIIRIIKSRHM